MINKFLLSLVCAATISSCNAITPQQQARVNEQLGDAALSGNLQGVQQALAAGADIHASNDLALRWAARYGHFSVMQYLVEHGAHIHAENDYALQWAAGNDHWIVAVYLLQQGAERTLLSAYQRSLLYAYIHFKLQTALGHDDWHKVEELLSIVHVQELPHYSQQEIKKLLVPAVQKKLNSACLVLPITPIALRALSFIVGPKTAAAFIYFIKEDTDGITQ